MSIFCYIHDHIVIIYHHSGIVTCSSFYSTTCSATVKCLYFFMYICYAGTATTSPLNDTIVREGNITTITCEAFGYPPPTVVWNRINGILSDRVSVSDSVSVLIGHGNVTRVSVNLTIRDASREDTGVYTCSANNSIGSDSSNVSITVQCKYL